MDEIRTQTRHSGKISPKLIPCIQIISIILVVGSGIYSMNFTLTEEHKPRFINWTETCRDKKNVSYMPSVKLLEIGLPIWSQIIPFIASFTALIYAESDKTSGVRFGLRVTNILAAIVSFLIMCVFAAKASINSTTMWIIQDSDHKEFAKTCPPEWIYAKWVVMMIICSVLSLLEGLSYCNACCACFDPCIRPGFNSARGRIPSKAHDIEAAFQQAELEQNIGIQGEEKAIETVNKSVNEAVEQPKTGVQTVEIISISISESVKNKEQKPIDIKI